MVGAPGHLPPAPPRGPAIDVFNFGGGRYQTYRQHPQGACRRRLLALMVAAAGSAASTPRGAAIDVFNFGGGRCRACCQHPRGVRRRCL
jgi:hypothetical protein